MDRPSNEDIAGALEQVADLLEVQDANPFRVRAYRQAAAAIRGSERSIAAMVDTGDVEGLASLPAVGPRISAAVTELVRTGRLALLDRLLGVATPEALFQTIPGIGAKLAHEIHRQLDVESLEELEMAAHDGRLERVDGIGPRRARTIRDVLEVMLSRSRRRRARRREPLPLVAEPRAEDEPPVELLLRIDARYRQASAAGRLRTIAPRRFNPRGEAWLPILHHDQDGWSFTAMYSNTARAHELGRTHDWVVLYYERAGYQDQCTVVTEHSGPLAGRRVVRGREVECARLYGGSPRPAGGVAGAHEAPGP